MKKLVFLLALSVLSANELSQELREDAKEDILSISTLSKNDKCLIKINNEIVLERTCEFEYNPSLIFYTKNQDYNDIWIFQDNPMGNACDGGKLRLFERKDWQSKVKYIGEIDYCGGPKPIIEVQKNEIKITDKSLDEARVYFYRNGKIEEMGH